MYVKKRIIIFLVQLVSHALSASTRWFRFLISSISSCNSSRDDIVIYIKGTNLCAQRAAADPKFLDIAAGERQKFWIAAVRRRREATENNGGEAAAH